MADAILITGAGGFVGSAVLRRLVRHLRERPVLISGEHEVSRVVAVLRPGGSRARFEELEPDRSWSLREVELGKPAAVRQLMNDVRPLAVVHAALDRTVHHESSDAHREARVMAPLHELLQSLAESGGRRFVHTGSAWVLPGGVDLDEETISKPDSPYAHAKDLEDRLLPIIAGAVGIEWLNLRLFNLFGRHERPDRLIPYLVARLLRGEPAELSAGGNVRDFTDVELLAEAYIRALESPATVANRVYHIGTGRGTRIADIATEVTKVVGGAELLHFGRKSTPDQGMRAQVANIDRARTCLGWNPPDDLQERVKAAAHWWSERLSTASSPQIDPRRPVP